MPRVAWLLSAAIVLSGLSACSGEHLGDGEDGGVRVGGSFGLLALTWEHDAAAAASTDTGAAELTATAQFVRYRQLDAQRVVRLLGLPLDPDRDLPPLETCDLDAGPDALTEDDVAGAADAYVDLLEAGTLHVDLPSRTLALSPRHFPGLVPFVSGAVYDELHGTYALPSGVVEAAADGADAVGSFRVGALLPAASRTLEVDAEPSVPNAPDAGRTLMVRWEAPTHVMAGDATYLELSIAARGPERVLRCAVRDDGAFEIPAPDVDELVPPGFHVTGGRLALDLVRVRRASFATRGLDAGELRLAVRTRTTMPAVSSAMPPAAGR